MKKQYISPSACPVALSVETPLLSGSTQVNCDDDNAVNTDVSLSNGKDWEYPIWGE